MLKERTKQLLQGIFLSATLIFLLNSLSFAQADPVFKEDHPGKWTYKYVTNAYQPGFALSPTELTALQNKLALIAEAVHKNTVVSTPKGIDLQVSGGCYESFVLGEGNHSRDMIPGKVDIKFCDWLSRDGKLTLQTMEVPVVQILTNVPAETYLGYNMNFNKDGQIQEITDAADKFNQIFKLPVLAKDLGNGIKLYNNNVMVIAADSKPYWVPVTIGEYYKMALDYYKAYAKKDPVEAKMLGEIFQKEKANFESHLNEPAYTCDGTESISAICLKSFPNAIPLMRFNPEYFDKRLPRTSVQLITVSGRNHLNPLDDPATMAGLGTGNIRVWELMNSLDGEKLKTLLDLK